MFTCYLQNVNNEYHVFIDGSEVAFNINACMKGEFRGDLEKGIHTIQITKSISNESFNRGCLLFWISSLMLSYDENVVSIRRSHKSVNIIFEIDVKNNDQVVVFDAYTNRITRCSESYVVLCEEIAEDKEKGKKVKKYIIWPVWVLCFLVIVPLFVLAVLMIVTSFDAPAVLLFVLTSGLLVLLIIAFVRYRINKW